MEFSFLNILLGSSSNILGIVIHLPIYESYLLLMIFLVQCSILKLFPIRIDLILPPQNRSFHNPQPSETSKLLHLPKVYPQPDQSHQPVSSNDATRIGPSFTCLGPCGQRGLLCPHGPKQVRSLIWADLGPAQEAWHLGRWFQREMCLELDLFGLPNRKGHKWKGFVIFLEFPRMKNF